MLCLILLALREKKKSSLFNQYSVTQPHILFLKILRHTLNFKVTISLLKAHRQLHIKKHLSGCLVLFTFLPKPPHSYATIAVVQMESSAKEVNAVSPVQKRD